MQTYLRSFSFLIAYLSIVCTSWRLSTAGKHPGPWFSYNQDAMFLSFNIASGVRLYEIQILMESAKSQVLLLVNLRGHDSRVVLESSWFRRLRGLVIFVVKESSLSMNLHG